MESLRIFVQDVQFTKIVIIACAAILSHELLSNLLCASIRRGVRFHWSRRQENEMTSDTRTATICTIVRKVSRLVFLLIAVLMILTEFGVNIAPVLTGAGILGVAIGFGSQTLIKDFLSGIFILAEGQFSVGDVIEVNGKMGKVVRLDLRCTVLRSDEGVEYYVPNSSMTVVANHTRAIALRARQKNRDKK